MPQLPELSPGVPLPSPRDKYFISALPQERALLKACWRTDSGRGLPTPSLLPFPCCLHPSSLLWPSCHLQEATGQLDTHCPHWHSGFQPLSPQGHLCSHLLGSESCSVPVMDNAVTPRPLPRGARQLGCQLTTFLDRGAGSTRLLQWPPSTGGQGRVLAIPANCRHPCRASHSRASSGVGNGWWACLTAVLLSLPKSASSSSFYRCWSKGHFLMNNLLTLQGPLSHRCVSVSGVIHINFQTQFLFLFIVIYMHSFFFHSYFLFVVPSFLHSL